MKAPESSNGTPETEKQVCGIVMPISETEGYPRTHWAEVKAILDDVIEQAGFKPNLVSSADEAGIIHNRIVSNIYNNPILICDVSSKNPNVMFELGLRLAFDKATIIIKDDATNYTFDTGVIEHITYPKSLRFADVNKFKIDLKSKLIATHQASLKPEYSTFLKHFVQYKLKLDVEEVDSNQYLLKRMDGIADQLDMIRKDNFTARQKAIIKYEDELYEFAYKAVNVFVDLYKEDLRNMDNVAAYANFSNYMKVAWPASKKQIPFGLFTLHLRTILPLVSNNPPQILSN